MNADVAVIGAGLVGLTLADQLVSSGLSVIVLESGGKTQSGDTHPLNDVEMVAQDYSGARDGRFRCLGGTSTRWGSALLPFLPSDQGPHPSGWHNGWGIDATEIEPFLANIESLFSVTHESYEGEAKLHSMLPSFVPRMPKWPAFRNRSTASLFRNQIASNPNLKVVIDATVTEILLNANEVVGLVANSMDGKQITINTNSVIIAAGAIESTRLMLLLNQSNDGILFPLDSPLGRGFHDHISAPVAELTIHDKQIFLQLFSLRFSGGGMRNLRFELSPEARARLGLPGAFLHIASTRSGESGFDGLRRAFQAVQRHKLPALTDIAKILADWPWFVRAVWWRFVKKRVLPPTGASFELHLVTEQKPDPANRIELSADRTDPLGLPLARITWNVSDEDKAHFIKIAQLLIAEWNEGPLGNIASAQELPQQDLRLNIVEGGGIFHPAGTTRLGANAAEGVVDIDLRVHGVSGLWLVATSVFPSVGGSSPSLGALQLALRAADNIIATTRSRNQDFN